ncbi:hypothetical protein GCM10023087_17160 [Microbacterium rhizosphaerae]
MRRIRRPTARIVEPHKPREAPAMFDTPMQLGEAVHPRCPDDDTVLRDVEGGWVCVRCGREFPVVGGTGGPTALGIH